MAKVGLQPRVASMMVSGTVATTLPAMPTTLVRVTITG
jgi:hypothetical protein